MNGDIFNKGLLAAFVAVFSFVYNSFGILFAILVLMMTLDYITGLSRAIIEKKSNSRTGIIGIIKKVGYVTLVVVAVLFDMAILHGAELIGTTMPIDNAFGTAVICGLISNEILSIIENLGAMGVPAPKFLVAAVKRFRKSAEKSFPEEDDEKGSE